MTDGERIGPDPNCSYPLRYYGRLCFLKNIVKNIVKNSNIIVGDYTDCDDFENPENFEKNVRHHFDFVGDKLTIGKVCAIASNGMLEPHRAIRAGASPPIESWKSHD